VILGNAATENANPEATPRRRIVGGRPIDRLLWGRLSWPRNGLSKRSPGGSESARIKRPVYYAGVDTVSTDTKGYLTRPPRWRSVSSRMLGLRHDALGRPRFAKPFPLQANAPVCENHNWVRNRSPWQHSAPRAVTESMRTTNYNRLFPQAVR
jgi:hypothetical protein